MDKVITGDWTNIFSRLKQTVVHSSQRYTEISVEAYEPGLSSVKSLMITIPGMIAQMINMKPEIDLVLQSTKEDECIQSAFILSGHADSIFDGKPVATLSNSHAFQYSPFVNESHKISGGNLEAFHIELDLSYFKNLLQSSGEGNLEMLFHSLEKKDTYLIPPDRLPLQVRMNEIIHSIQSCTFNSLTRAMFMEAKMLELLALQFEQMILVDRPVKEPFNKTDREKLFAVKDFIEKNYLQTLSLKKICQMFGLNEFKLKKGYKMLFGATVFGHIHHLRMQEAMQLLLQKNMTVSEIADLVGYCSAGNFSTEFKKKFGFPPTKAIAL